MADTFGKLFNDIVSREDAATRFDDIEKKIDDEKLTYKAKKLLGAEKRAKLNQDHVSIESFSLNFEKQLRKVATRGVVKFLNAAKNSQKTKTFKTDNAKAFMDYIKSATPKSTQKPKENQEDSVAQAANSSPASVGVAKKDSFIIESALENWDQES